MNEVCVQTIYVPNLALAMDFYVQALGYEVKARYGPCIAQLQTQGTTLVVQQLEAGQAGPDRPSAVLAFRTENIAETMGQVVAAGGTLLNETPQPCPVGVFVAFRDVAGVHHELLQFADA